MSITQSIVQGMKEESVEIQSQARAIYNIHTSIINLLNQEQTYKAIINLLYNLLVFLENWIVASSYEEDVSK